MRTHRSARFALLLALASTAVIGAQTPPAVPGVDEALKPVRERFAPDRRLAVFDVAVEKTAQGLTVTGEVESAEAKAAAIQALKAAGHADLTDRIAVLPDAALAGATRGIVRVSVANVKSKPSHPAEMATQAVMGWTVRILKKQSGWYYVHTEPDNYLGWIEELQLAQITEDAATAWARGQPRHRHHAHRLRARNGRGRRDAGERRGDGLAAEARVDRRRLDEGRAARRPPGLPARVVGRRLRGVPRHAQADR